MAKETGVSPRERARMERHEALAEEFPFMQRAENGWIKGTIRHRTLAMTMRYARPVR